MTDQSHLDRIEVVAERIFVNETHGLRNFDGGKMADRAFAKAKAFCEKAADIRAGAKIKDLYPSENTLQCLVDLVDMSKGEHGTPDIDPDSGQVRREVQPVDRWAFAPNCHDSHPINQRFLPIAIRNKRLCDPKGRLLTDEEVASLDFDLDEQLDRLEQVKTSRDDK